MAFVVVSASASPAWADALGSPARISVTGGPGDDSSDARDPSLAFNTQTGRYLAVWQARSPADEANEDATSARLTDALPAGTTAALAAPGPRAQIRSSTTTGISRLVLVW